MESKITHRELLNFSNLTNLEWEFVDLTAEKKNGVKKYPKLNNLLKPEAFAIRNEEGRVENYAYMDVKDKDNISAKEKEQGLIEMRKQAGVAMEYSEHTKEGGIFKGLGSNLWWR